MSKDDQDKSEKVRKDAGDHDAGRTTQKTANEAVTDAPQAKKYQESFTSFSAGTPAVNPLVLEDSKTGQKFYDAEEGRKKAAGNNLSDGQHEKVAQATRLSDHVVTTDSTHATARGDGSGPIKQEFTAYVPDYKTIGMPGVLPRVVEVHLGPSDNVAIEQRYKQILHGKDPASLSQFDRDKLHNLAICDVFVDKYQSAMTKQEMKDSQFMPEQMRGMFLAGQALEDGAALGATRAVLHKVIDEGALGDLASGTAIGLAFGKVVAKLACNVNPWTRTAAMVLQTGGLALAIKDVGEIGNAGVNGFMCSVPALQQLCANPTEQNLAHAKQSVDEHLGPPLADAELTVLGIAAAHGLEKGITRGGKPGGGAHETHGENNPGGGPNEGRGGDRGPGGQHSPDGSPKINDGGKQAGGEPKSHREGDATAKKTDQREVQNEVAKPHAKPEVVVEGDTTHPCRKLKVGDKQLDLLHMHGYFIEVTGKSSKSPVKVHVLTDSPQDLGRLQQSLIPEIIKDPVLQKHIAKWKMIDPNYGEGKGGYEHGAAPTGEGQGAKGFTIYTETPEDAIIVQKRLDEICNAKGLSRDKHIDTGNCDDVPGVSKRVAICRDTFPRVQDAAGHPGSCIDDSLAHLIGEKFDLRPGERLSADRLHMLEKYIGIEPGLLTYSREGHLMLKGSGQGRPYHGTGWYADESQAGKEFGHLTERPALYALYRKFGFDPGDPRFFGKKI